ncbi:MAG: hypothetical protein FD171_2162 [Actinobacteria bacterium]|nr:MAG: hypothetical protein FD171_2162 [Actinomycetota bacterium]
MVLMVALLDLGADNSDIATAAIKGLAGNVVRLRRTFADDQITTMKRLKAIAESGPGVRAGTPEV